MPPQGLPATKLLQPGSVSGSVSHRLAVAVQREALVRVAQEARHPHGVHVEFDHRAGVRVPQTVGREALPDRFLFLLRQLLVRRCYCRLQDPLRDVAPMLAAAL